MTPAFRLPPARTAPAAAPNERPLLLLPVPLPALSDDGWNARVARWAAA